MDVIQMNKFAEMHNGSDIIFCKHWGKEYLTDRFREISALQNDVVFITGNSDYCITDDIAEEASPNIKKWFCQNRLSKNPLLESIPLGIENHIDCVVEGDGEGWSHAVEKYEILSNPPSQPPTKFIYGNFSPWTSMPGGFRPRLREMVTHSPFMTWSEPNLTYVQFVNEILDHEAVLCPQGNGPGDNHRIYETLYLNRIPITFSKAQNDFLHNKFPTVLVESSEQLEDEKWLIHQIANAKLALNKKFLDFSYWKNLIMEYAA